MRFHKALACATLLAVVALVAATPTTAATAEGSCPNSMVTRSPVLRRLLAPSLTRGIGANYTLTFTGMPTSLVTRAVTTAPNSFRSDIEADMMSIFRSRGVTSVTVGVPKTNVGGGGVNVEVRLWCSCGALLNIDQLMTTTQPPVNLLSAVTRGAWGMTAASVKVDTDNSVEKNYCAKGPTTTVVAKLQGTDAIKLGVVLPIGLLILGLVFGVMWWRKKKARAALLHVTNPSTTGVPASGVITTHQPLVFASSGASGHVNSSGSSPTPYGGPAAPGYGQAPPPPMGYPAAASPPPGMAPYGGYGQQPQPMYGQQAPAPYGQPPPAPYSSSPVPPPGYPQQPYGGSPAPYNTGAPPPAPAYAAAPGMVPGAAPGYGAAAPAGPAPGAAAPAPAGGIATGPVTFYSS